MTFSAPRPLVIGTRGSELALWQARHVQSLLGGEAAGVTLQIIKTSGDQLLDIPLQNQLDKGFFTKELEVALLDGRVDLAVHSLKDLPTQMPEGLILAAIPPRAATADLLLMRPAAHAPERPLPSVPGARIGTASMRRTALLHHADSTAVATFLRGNVPTRLGKAISGELDAVLLARAGVERLGLPLDQVIAYELSPLRWLAAAGQGALGLQARAGDQIVLDRLQALHHAETAAAVDLERGLLRKLEGGCHTAFGARAVVTGPLATLTAGLTDSADRWHAVEVRGAVADLIDAGFEALQAVLRGAPHPADVTAAGAEEPWGRQVHAWS